MRRFLAQGRRNKGSIFVFAAGNGGVTGDSCAFNGYVNSIYTIAISGANWDGKVPGHAEPCAAIMAVTYGEDKYDRRKAPVVSNKSTEDKRKELTVPLCYFEIFSCILDSSMIYSPSYHRP